MLPQKMCKHTLIHKRSVIKFIDHLGGDADKQLILKVPMHFKLQQAFEIETIYCLCVCTQ